MHICIEMLMAIASVCTARKAEHDHFMYILFSYDLN